MTQKHAFIPGFLLLFLALYSTNDPGVELASTGDAKSSPSSSSIVFHGDSKLMRNETEDDPPHINPDVQIKSSSSSGGHQNYPHFTAEDDEEDQKEDDDEGRHHQYPHRSSCDDDDDVQGNEQNQRKKKISREENATVRKVIKEDPKHSGR